MADFGRGALEVRARHPVFHEWLLDFDNEIKPHDDGHFQVAKNLILADKLGAGGFWNIEASSHGYTIMATAGDSDEFFLDFINDENLKEPRGGTYIADNLILAKPAGRGAKWRIEERSGGITIQATAGHYEGWYLDFNSEGGVHRQGNYLISRNLILCPRLGSGAIWNFLPQRVQLKTSDGRSGDSSTISCGVSSSSNVHKLVGYVLPPHYVRDGFSRSTESNNGHADVDWFSDLENDATVILKAKCNPFGDARAEVKAAFGKLVRD